MPIECRRSTTGGKGNRGMYIERDPKVVAAGLPTAQQDEKVENFLKHYLLQEEADALIGDAIIPPPKARPLPPLRKPIPLDMRFAGPNCTMAQLLSTSEKTKFTTLISDFKSTAYLSYWRAPLGKTRDPVPMLPEGFDINGTTFGRPNISHGRLYDIVMPKIPYPDKTPPSKNPGVQLDRKYCIPPYNPDLTYGHRTYVDKRGTYARCCVSDDRIKLGATNRVICNTVQSNLLNIKQPRVGLVLAPNNNIREVPDGYSFGILKKPDSVAECLAYCEINKGVAFFKQCMKHLNTIRKALSSRFLPTFFHQLYLNFKFYDPDKTGWLPKDIVYKYCNSKLIRFDPALIEPLLSTWQAFDGTRIEYKTFARVLNYRIPSPEIPKISELKADCLDYTTTYREMVKPGQAPDTSKMAGLPSGRYFDLDFPISPERCCVADRTCLPHESDMKSCIAPSILTQSFVSHREMYEKRNPVHVRKVFEAIGEKFTDESFDAIWKEAQKYHTQGWVCYETFRQALESHTDVKETDK